MHRLLIAVVLGAGLAAACRSSRESGQAASPAPAAAEAAPEIPDSVHLTAAAISESGIQTWKVQPMDLEHLLVLTGTVGHNENRFVAVASNVGGRVAEIPVDLGQSVRKGQPVVWIESVELGRAWDDLVKALVDQRVAKLAYERALSLRDAQVMSTSEFQALEAVYLGKKIEAGTLARTLRLYGEDEAEIEAVRAAIDGTSDLPLTTGGPHRLAVRAPFDGKVIERRVTPGSLVEALQPLVSVANLSEVWVFLKVYEKDLPLVARGLTMSVRTEAYPQASFPGRIDFLGSVVDPASRTAQVRATVKNPSESLRPGMFVTARVDVPRPQAEAHPMVAVPESALQTLETRTVVFVETSRGVFVRRPVETGHTFEGFTEILAGVKAGEEIVTEGSFVLKSEFAKAMLKDDD
jgi:cobalt-zinc-cadmium efflux system membrane fusion protein